MRVTVPQEQLDELGRAYHRGDAIACPLCHSQLKTEERRYMSRVSVPVLFFCPVHEYLGQSEPSELRTSWPDDQMRGILADYLRRGETRCPEDQAKLSVIYQSGESGAYLHVVCPSCGRLQEGPPPTEVGS